MQIIHRSADKVTAPWTRAERIAISIGLRHRGARDLCGRGPRGYRRSDERIWEDVCESLTDDPYVDASDIEVTVKEGEVTLVGTVNAREAKRRVEDLVDRVSGVRAVHNTLRIATAVISAESDIEGVGGTPGAASGMSGAGGH